MRAACFSFICIALFGAAAGAETIEEAFERIRAERLQKEHELAQKNSMLYVLRVVGADTTNVKMQFSDGNFSYVSNGKVACEIRNYLINEARVNFPDYAEYRRQEDKIVRNATSCKTITLAADTPRAEYKRAVENRRAREFLAVAKAAIREAGADPDEFAVPSDYMTREAANSPLHWGGLYVDGPRAICKLMTVYSPTDVKAECVQK